MTGEKSLFWADQLAEKIILRSEHDGRVPNVKCQQTPSGGKHIGNLNDVLRAWFPVKAVREKGGECTFVHTTDDRDPLKDVPARLSDLEGRWHSSADFPWLKEELGKPLCRIKDPFGCCQSWSIHFTKVWMKGLELLNVKPRLYSVNSLYMTGMLEPFVRKVFENAREAGKIVRELQESKAEGYIPFDAICPNCGRLANADSFDLENKTVHFVCGGKEIKKKKTEGCGYEGDVPWREGKLQWRFEWPALMALFHTTFEPFGKDHWEGSWKSVLEIMPRIFGAEPPIPFVYEFFLVNGEKMSASKGNVYIVQDVLEIMEPEAFLFFYTKRPEMQRDLELGRIWQLVDEFDSAERVYFGVEKGRTENREENAKRMYELTVPEIPKKCPQRVSYQFASALVQVLDDDAAIGKLVSMGHLDAKDKESIALAGKRFALARNWIEKYAPPEAKLVVLDEPSALNKMSPAQRKALADFAQAFERGGGEKALGGEIKRICQENGLAVQDFYACAYTAFIGKERGPKLVPFLSTLDKKMVVGRLKGVA